MALIKCTECGKEFSDKANACPNCGCPTVEILSEISSEEIMIADESKNITDIEQNGTNKKENINLSRKTKSNRHKKGKKVGLVAGAVVITAAVIVTVTFFMTQNSRDYSNAKELFDAKNYAEAETVFLDLGDYKDSTEMVTECEYQIGNEAYEAENFEDALKIFEGIESYKDSAELIEKCNYELTVDGQFMRSISKGLTARWDKSDEYEKAGKGYEDPDIYREYCQIELNHIESFYNLTFNDANLQADAKQYIDYLMEAQDATNQYTVNYSAYYDKWADVYANRTILLQKMVSEYGLSVDEEHQDTLDNLLIDAMAAAESKKVKEDVAEMCKLFEVTVEQDAWGYQTYGLKMKNTTDLTFEYFYVYANIVDDDGNIVATGSGGNLENWKPGAEANGDFYIDNSDIDLSSYKVEFAPHYSAGSYYE